MYANSLNYFFN